MTSIVPTVCEIESEYGSVIKADLFDPRLVMIRKRFNNGIDPIQEKKLDIDIGVAQRLLDSKMTKEKIAKVFGIKENELQRYIFNGYLNDDIGKRKHDKRRRKARFQLYKNGDYIMEGTYEEIAEATHISRASLAYYRSEKYKSRRHTTRYRLVPIK